MKYEVGHIGFVLVLIALALLCMAACAPEKPLSSEQKAEIERQYSAQAGTHDGSGNQWGGL